LNKISICFSSFSAFFSPVSWGQTSLHDMGERHTTCLVLILSNIFF
jgi:hypothetical protein